MKKSELETRPESPISFHPSSNGEFEPRPVTDQDRRAAAMYQELVERKARRLGMTRREFAESASGMVAALFVINQVYGCSSTGMAGRDGGGGAGAVAAVRPVAVVAAAAGSRATPASTCPVTSAHPTRRAGRRTRVTT